MNEILIQIIGAIGYSLFALSYIRKDKNQILLMQILSYIFFSIHYYLLNGITGVICNLIQLFALVVIYIFDKYKLKNKILISVFFITILLVINIVTFQNIYSLFPLIASSLVIISFLLNDEDIIKFIGMIIAVCWLFYAIFYKSYAGIIFEFITIVNICTFLFKKYYRISNK